ncbi:MAG: serine/threonine protein kinase [Lachnospiraceae bacterium]|nr:serine/threonine protein kinase [Lachnospiraceae bacterium]
MRDKRIALPGGTRLYTNDNRTIQIRGEVGRGASCIVYDAAYEDNIGVWHDIRIKECYPVYLPVDRETDGSLKIDEDHEADLSRAKQSFLLSYKRNTEIRNTLGLTNSTVNATNILHYNNTIYIVMALDEGTDYRVYEDGSLKELFVHVKSLAELIKKYHQNGFLHLDIKPENILILPETQEHILLFDFDSIIAIDELAKTDKVRLSFSDGFSAPEQVRGEINKIGKTTDIYSIGALVFFKLFGRKPVLKDCKISSVFHFESMKYASEKYRPKMYRSLSVFFRKTLSASTVSRWNDVQTVIDALEELIAYADIDGVYLLDSFHYNSACFVGRCQEIEKTDAALQEEGLVFLSGIGGIGKTEVARRYAFNNRDRYDTITFSVFESSIKELVCNEVKINGVTREEKESDEDYFKRKLEILKNILTPKDLLIIDNFDVEMDEDLELLLECPCKFIVTTREDFRDFNYPQINIDKIDDIEEILELFRSYNDIIYSPDEDIAVKRIIDLVDHHTMTVELIAKYLRDANESPESLYGRFLQKEGITGADQINVKQRKDSRLRIQSINTHLRILFDVSGFDHYESEIISSLSLFAGIRMKKSKFEELCAVEEVEIRLEALIKRGWIEFDDQTEKISLHQVIQDLIYKELHPDTSGCPHIVAGINRYLSAEMSNEAERNIRSQVFDVFMRRISGNDIPYVRLCLKYGKEDKLDEANEICLKSSDEEAFDLLYRIYRKKILFVEECKDLFQTDLDLNEYQKSKYIEIAGLLDKASEYCNMYSDAPEYIAREFVEMGIEVEDGLTYGMLDRPGETQVPELDEIYVRIIKLFDIATEKLPYAKLGVKEKEVLYEKMQVFYEGTGFYGAIYGDENFTDIEKALWYQEQIDALKDDDSPYAYLLRNVSNMDLASEYMQKGNYEKAIECCEKACRNGEEIFSVIMACKSEAYLEMGNVEKAIECLEQIQVAEKKDSYYSGNKCLDLIKLLIEQKEYERARDHALELLHYKEKELEKGEYMEAVKKALGADYYLFLLEEDPDKKENLWAECVNYYERLEEEMIDEDLYDFLLLYVQKTDIPYAEIIKLLDRIYDFEKKGRVTREKILLLSIQKYSGRESFGKWHVIFLLRLSEMSNDPLCREREKALQYFSMAQEISDRYKLEDAYIKSLLCNVMADILLNDDDNDYEQIRELKEQCDYELMAEREIQYGGYSDERKIDAWRDAANKYQGINRYEKRNICLRRAVGILSLALDRYEYYEFDRKYWPVITELIEAYIYCGEPEAAYAELNKLYGNIIDCFMRDKEEKDLWNIVSKTVRIAGYLEETGKRTIALKLYTAAMYLAVEAEPDLELVSKMDIPNACLDRICDEICMHLKKGIEPQTIDRLIEIKDKMLKESGEGDDIGRYLPIIRIIVKEYQYQEIEFKRI